MIYLLDTCVLSELTRPQPNPSVIAWIRMHAETSCYLSVLTIGELVGGIRRLPVAAKRVKLEGWLQSELLLRFKDRILVIDEAVATRWGSLIADTCARGRVLPTIDSLLAAIAQEHGLTIITRNIKDFVDVGVKVLNPWES